MTSFSDITHVAGLIAADGITTISPGRIRSIARDAVQRGASPVLAQIVMDPAEPAVARARAFGRISAAFLTSNRPLTRAA